MMLALSLVLVAAVCAPHLVNLERTRPVVAATIWSSALVLRALTAAYIAVFAILYVRASELFGLVTHWCWHGVVPFLATHLGLNGHELGDVATIAPSVVLSVSIVSAAYGMLRATRAIRTLVGRSSLGPGPENSVVVAGQDVVLAAAGLSRPRILVSTGALTRLDDGELRASLAHERGHIVRGHRFILLGAELCRAMASFLPGSGRARDELAFHLERDADAWALDRSDPLDLASAICKAAVSRGGVALTALGGHAGPRRVTELLETRRPARRVGLPHGLALAMVGVALALTALFPPATSAGVQTLREDRSTHECPS